MPKHLYNPLDLIDKCCANACPYIIVTMRTVHAECLQYHLTKIFHINHIFYTVWISPHLHNITILSHVN